MTPDANAPDPTSPPGSIRVLNEVTCPACGCLCDDLQVRIEGDTLLDVASACPVGSRWFATEAARPIGPPSFIEGIPVSPSDALDRAASLLRQARCPVLFGLTRTTIETAREALALADRLGARVVLDRSVEEMRRVAAFQNQGRVTATLGEVKNRADAIIFWRCDPARTHPRHFERYSIDAPGRFVPEGRRGRFVVAVDREKTATAEAADVFLQIDPAHDLALIKSLRMLLSGRPVEPIDCGIDLDTFSSLKRRIGTNRRYWAVFVGRDDEPDARSPALLEEITRLVRQANDHFRVVMLGLGRAVNLAGAESILTWQTGQLGGVDFARGGPHPIDGSGTLNDVLESGGPDAILAVADPWPDLSESAKRHLESIPRIVIGPPAILGGDPAPSVALASATPAIDASGTVTRVDGVNLPVRALFPGRQPSDGEWLRRLLDRFPDEAAPR